MPTRLTWSDACDAAGQLTYADRRTLFLLARLPLLPATTVRDLSGLAIRSTYERLERLREAGLVARVRATLAAHQAPCLLLQRLRRHRVPSAKVPHSPDAGHQPRAVRQPL